MVDTGKKVLIADDDRSMVRAFFIRLRRLGILTAQSRDTTHALFAAKTLHPDLIVMDVNMPDGNGLAACEMLF